MVYEDKLDYNDKIKKRPLDKVIEELSNVEYSKWESYLNSETYAVYTTEVLGFKATIHKRLKNEWIIRQVDHFYIELENEDGWIGYNKEDEEYNQEGNKKIGQLFKNVEEGRERHLQEVEEKKIRKFESKLSKFGQD